MRFRTLGVAVAGCIALAGPTPSAGAASGRQGAAGGAAKGQVPAGCGAYLAHRSRPAIRALDPRPGAPRIFAMQYKQDVANVTSYGSFRTKIDCLLRVYVLPNLARGRPNVVVFNEDVGLATVAIGSRGAVARDTFARSGGPSCESSGQPCGTLAALTALTAAYAGPLSALHLRFPSLTAVGQVFAGATDTIVRGFLGTFSDLARRYGVYMIGSGDLPEFSESTAPADRAVFSDPDLRPQPASVYVASSPEIHNQVFLWGPRNVRNTGPLPLRNVVASNLKVPLTPIEIALGFTPGPATGPAAVANLKPYALPGTRARLGFATSLPAFVYGSPPAGTDPCSDTSLYYMRCLDRLGTNLVIQDEANPGRWTGADGDGLEAWQPLSWMSSTYRTVSDPTVHFSYNVTAMMVGNLADLVFDGQSAITQRGLQPTRARRPTRSTGRKRASRRVTGPARATGHKRPIRRTRTKRAKRPQGCHYVGDAVYLPSEDERRFAGYAGNRIGFLALAPWVVPDASRTALRAVGAKLVTGSHSPLENDYLETAIVADLPFPVDRRRPGCVSG